MNFHIVLGTRLIAASSLPLNDASPLRIGIKVWQQSLQRRRSITVEGLILDEAIDKAAEGNSSL